MKITHDLAPNGWCRGCQQFDGPPVDRFREEGRVPRVVDARALKTPAPAAQEQVRGE